MRLTLHYGTAESLKGKVEAAGFLSELMLRGTKNLNRQQIQDALDKNFARLGGGMGGMGGRRMGGGARSGRCRTRSRPSGPTFPPSSRSFVRSCASPPCRRASSRS